MVCTSLTGGYRGFRLGLGGATECDSPRRMARRQQGRELEGSAIRQRIIRCTEEGRAYPDIFPFFPFLLNLLVLGHIDILACVPTQPLHVSSRIDRGELFGVGVASWLDRGSRYE